MEDRSRGASRGARRKLWYYEDIHERTGIPINTLRFWRQDGRLKGVRAGKRVLFTPQAVADAVGVDVADLV